VNTEKYPVNIHKHHPTPIQVERKLHTTISGCTHITRMPGTDNKSFRQSNR